LPSFLRRDPAGREGYRHHRASHKPHAVIADGAAMQRVPGALRFLQLTCREAGVPLFIVNDPRVWGGNTHQSLNDAIRDMRKTIKYKVIEQFMREGAFARGRLLGQLEKETEWLAKDLRRQTQQVMKDMKRQLEESRRKDWSKLDADELHEKLVEYNTIKVIERVKGKPSVSQYSDGLLELARRCIEATKDGIASRLEAESDALEDTDFETSVINTSASEDTNSNF
jgi:hypothetical protein